jgi:hypothetical protein
MPNSKTTPSAPKPVERNGWIRKSDLDAWLGRYLPIPTQAVSNEEFFPIPQTPEQKRLEHEIFAGAEREKRGSLEPIGGSFCALLAGWRWPLLR